MKGLVAAIVLVVGCSGQEAETVNHPPFIASASPAEGEIVTPSAVGDRELSATIGDDDVGDALFIRILVDYPPGGGVANLIRALELPPSGSVIRSPMRMQPDCRNLGVGPGTHRLVLSVADRPFLDPDKGESVDPEAPLDSVAEQGNRVRLVWLLNCP